MIRIDYQKLGLGMLAAGMPLMQLANDKRAWWIGMVMMTLGPIVAALKSKGHK